MFTPISYTGKLFRRYLHTFKHPSKIRIQNLLGRFVFEEGIRMRNDEGIVFTLNANDWITRILLLEGSYEDSSIRLAKKILSKGGVFIDVGANFGLYTCIVSENLSVQVISIEPNYLIMPLLLKNIKSNNRHNVKILHTALGTGIDFYSLNAMHVNNMGTASFKPGVESSYSILGCSLDYVFKSQGIKEVELIKLDIEGNELDVLQCFSFDKYYVKNILLEHNNHTTKSLNRLRSFFFSKGFLMQNIHGQHLSETNAELPESNVWLVNISNQSI